MIRQKLLIPLLIIISIIFLNPFEMTFAQDTTVTVVAPGFVHYSISDPAGPFYIQILKVDLTLPENKITTALANDRLGAGFERTSALSSRKSKSGNIVVGAVNGDFYGISDPTNPYGFLANSQIIDAEYVFGRTHIRSSFGVVDDNKPTVQVINFSGSVTAVSSNSLNITGFNSQRVTDALVLYNKYFGPSTLTNEYGTEAELEPLNSFTTNSNMQFKVINKVAGVGNMLIQPGRYILSGHGSSKTFLDQNINIDDTISMVIGSSPDLGNLTALIGGGPRLLIDGAKPTTFVGFEGMSSDFVNTRHPRTAAGFNQDSTIAYFVVVDGRQATLSVGMSLDELADLMLSMGAYNAVNLDGGGSSTMVIHNQVVNSPSDLGGERSVANSLFAVQQVEITAPGVPTLIIPENGAENQRDTIIFKWSGSENSAVYDLQIGTNPTFSTGIVVNKVIIINTSYSVTGLNGLTTYYWRVRARNALGASSYSPAFNFQTGFPTIPVLISPPHATLGVSTSPTLIWAKESVSDSYHLQLSLGSTIVPENTIIDTIVVQDTTLSVSGLNYYQAYYWRAKALNQFGASIWSQTIGFKTELATSHEEIKFVPSETKLEQNYPNPFNPETTIKFLLAKEDEVIIKVFNALGSEIAILADGFFSTGSHSVIWDASGFSSGIYFFSMITGEGNVITRRMILLK